MEETIRRKLPPRVRQACMRCRRQKLRCDNERPCALCVRSSVECVESAQPARKRAKTNDHRAIDTIHKDKLLSELHGKSDISGKAKITIARNSLDSASDVAVSNRAHQESSISTPHQERTSTYGLVDQLFQKFDSASGLLPGGDGLPGGSPDQVSSARSLETVVRVSDLIGQDLPPVEIVSLLFDTFLDSVHWFMMVFHEPTLRIELAEIVSTGCVQPRRFSFVVLNFVIMAIGAKYTTEEAVQKAHPGTDLETLQASLMKKVEEKFLDIFDEGDIESVQICILLGSLYLYHRQPKRAFVVGGSAIKSAHAMGLHRESTWGELDTVTREVRRRVWLALYVYDVFAAVTYGRPCTILEGDWKVGEVQNIDDTSSRVPGFESLEQLEDGTYQPVTILSYQRLKYKLYRIASRITRNVYFKRGGTMQDVVEQVKDINDRLLELERNIPYDMRLSSFPPKVDYSSRDPIYKTFHLQALALQLMYDNMQLILHRPLLAYNSLQIVNPFSNRRVVGENSKREASSNIVSPSHSADILKVSKTCCWESAMRMSKLCEHPSVMRRAQNTHAARYAAIQTFTAGVVLAIFALSNPLSAQAQESKRAVSRIIRMPKSLGYRTAVSDQCGRILEELVRLILAEEMKSLISDVDADSEGNKNYPTSHDQIRRPSLSAETSDSRSLSVTSQHGDGPTTDRAAAVHRGPIYSTNLPSPYHQIDNLTDGSMAPNTVFPDGTSWVLSGNFNDALTSLQHVFRDSGLNYSIPHDHRQRSDMDGHAIGSTPASAHSPAQTHPQFQSPREPSFHGGGILGGLDGSGQTWIWGNSFDFT